MRPRHSTAFYEKIYSPSKRRERRKKCSNSQRTSIAHKSQKADELTPSDFFLLPAHFAAFSFKSKPKLTASQQHTNSNDDDDGHDDTGVEKQSMLARSSRDIWRNASGNSKRPARSRKCAKWVHSISRKSQACLLFLASMNRDPICLWPMRHRPTR